MIYLVGFVYNVTICLQCYDLFTMLRFVYNVTICLPSGRTRTTTTRCL